MSERNRRHLEAARRYACFDTGWNGSRPGTMVAILLARCPVGYGVQITTVSSWTARTMLPKLSLLRPRYRVLEIYRRGERLWPRESFVAMTVRVARPALVPRKRRGKARPRLT